MSGKIPHRTIEWMADQRWAMEPSMLAQMQEIAFREGSLEAVMASRGTPVDHSAYVTLHGSTAVIDVIGPISRYGSFFSYISGGCSVELLAQEFKSTIQDPKVQRVIMHVDSPGGSASGVMELATLIRSLRTELNKEVIAYVSDRACSGGYWIAAAADRIVASPTAFVGCIGVVASFLNTSKRDANQGIERMEIVSTLTPYKRPDVGTEEGRAQVLSLIDATATQFIESVASFREFKGTLEEKAKACGEGRIFVGQEAVDVGLADAVGSMESLLRETAGKPPPTYGRNPMSAEANSEEQQGLLQQIAARLGINIGAQAQQPATVPITETQEYKEATAALRKQLRTQAETQITTFISANIRAGRIFPAEAEALQSAMLQAFEDDQNSPQAAAKDDPSKTRLATLKSIVEKRAPHVLLGKQLAASVPEDAMVLENKETTTDSGLQSNAPIKPQRLESLMGLTDLGRQVLAETKKGAS